MQLGSLNTNSNLSGTNMAETSLCGLPATALSGSWYRSTSDLQTFSGPKGCAACSYRKLPNVLGKEGSLWHWISVLHDHTG